MTLNTSVLITLALTLMRRCGEGCVETFPNLTDSSTECKNTMRTCRVTCKPGKIFYDGSYTKTYRCDEDNIWFPSVPRAGCKDKAQTLYWIRLTAKYHTYRVAAAFCLKAHDKALNDAIGNLTQQYLSFCMEYARVGSISISNITSTTSSFEIITILEFKLVNASKASFNVCAVTLKLYAKTFMTYDSPITCSTGQTSNVTIEDDIVNSNITTCQDHYILVNDSNGRNHCVLDIPVVGVKSTSYLTQIHEDVVLHCEVQFSSSVEYLYWQHDYLNITVYNNARYSGGTIGSPSLTIHDVTYEDKEYYTCSAVSQSGTGTSLLINLTVVGDGVDEKTTVHHTPTSNGGLTDSINETSTGGLTDNITETSTGGLTYNITETSTGGLTDNITETSTGGLTDNITETSTGGLTDGITETSTGGLTDDITETKNDQTLYIAIGAGCGGGILIIVVLLIVIKSCRKTSSSSPRGSNNTKLEQDHRDSYDSDYGGLKDNSMYIPFDQHELIDQNYSTINSQRSPSAESRLATDGNYSSADLTFSLATANDHTSMDANRKSLEKSRRSSGNKYADQNTEFINDDSNQTPTGSNDIYAQVDNSREKKPAVDKIQPNIDEVRQQDQTYAVVNKTK